MSLFCAVEKDLDVNGQLPIAGAGAGAGYGTRTPGCFLLGSHGNRFYRSSPPVFMRVGV